MWNRFEARGQANDDWDKYWQNGTLWLIIMYEIPALLITPG